MIKTWRDSARGYIQDAIKSNLGIDEKSMRKVLRAAYPFGERSYHPYKIWCDEVKKTLAKLYPGGKAMTAISMKKALNEEVKNQLKLL